MVKRFSNKPQVDFAVQGAVGVASVTIKVRAPAARFVSANMFQLTAPADWTEEQNRLVAKLEAYEAIRLDLATRYQPSQHLSLTAQSLPDEATTSAMDAWISENLTYINDLLEKLEYYRKNAGVVSSPQGFVPQAQGEIDRRYLRFWGLIEKARQNVNERYLELASGEHIGEMTVDPVLLTRVDKQSEREYALYRAIVWESERELLTQQWRILADAVLAREEAELTHALGVQGPMQENREGIPSAVRNSVWNRDSGRCRKCGSRERLEYDHIIPVAKGGSSTERNIELLCEACNRAKSDQIS